MSLRNTLFTVCVVGFLTYCNSPLGLAEEPQGALDASPPTTRVLLFRSGRALEGPMDETESHYIVLRPIGKIEIAKSEVELVANDLDEVYRYKLERLRHDDPDAHMRLAQWCLIVNLRERAIEELERCAELMPNPTRPKALLENLRRTPPPDDQARRTSQEPPKPEPTQPSRPFPSFQRELTPAQVSTFSVQIQPLLVRSCANAGCHDTNHPGSLILQGSARPSQRSSQQNLRSVLAQIDPEEPALSPLLTESLRAHGAARRSPFVTGSNDPAYAKLADWIRAVCGKPAEKPTSNPRIAATGTPSPGPSKPMDKSPGNETASPNLVYSNKPIAPTPARLRAGMTLTNSPSDTNSARAPVPKGENPNEVQGEPEHGAGLAPVARSPAKPVTRNSDSKPMATDPRISPKLDGKPVVADSNPSEMDSPIDPFDPEIFNRQFAPR